MLAVKGYYDGKEIKLLEKIDAQPNQKVIITVVDELVDEHGNTIMKLNRAIKDPEELAKKADELMGILSEYANPELAKQEEGAWERAVVEKYGNPRY